MTPSIIPRMHLFEIDDQPWFHPWLRARVQDGLMHAWTFSLPPLHKCSPATLVADVLLRILGTSVSKYTFIDFCAGAGGPTPFIERALNSSLRRQKSTKTNFAALEAAKTETETTTEAADPADGNPPSYASVTANCGGGGAAEGNGLANFILTDLHPHPESWSALSAQSPQLSYIPEPVDASAAPASLIARYKNQNGNGETTGPSSASRVFRLYNLAFHHFDDPLARAILRNTVETSDGFGIFELQDRSLASFITCILYGALILLAAPFFYWWSPARLFFIYACPIIPFVLVFDGLVSSLRTRTPEEVEVLLRTCGAEGGTSDWVVQSGRERFMWPAGYLNWVVCVKHQESTEPRGVGGN